MSKKVIIDALTIEAQNLWKENVTRNGRDLIKIGFDFKVSSSEYHDVTTLLYKNNFNVKVPDLELSFQATISNYSTSITNLYEENNVGDFYLELIERYSE